MKKILNNIGQYLGLFIFALAFYIGRVYRLFNYSRNLVAWRHWMDHEAHQVSDFRVLGVSAILLTMYLLLSWWTILVVFGVIALAFGVAYLIGWIKKNTKKSVE